MRDVLRFIDDALARGEQVAMVTLSMSGHGTPGVTGNIMAVLKDGTICGTVGGGAVEYDVIQRSVQALKTGESFDFDYDLSRDGPTGMICGGSARGFVNVLSATHTVVIFGGGHVGAAVCEIAARSGLAVWLVEDREELLQNTPASRTFHGSMPETAQQMQLDHTHHVVIVTRGHAFDYDVLRAVVQKPCGYIGMIGSSSKIAATFQKLRDDSVSQQEIDNIYTPVGLTIDNGSPREIAVSIVAEILSVKNGKTPRHARDAVKERIAGRI